MHASDNDEDVIPLVLYPVQITTKGKTILPLKVMVCYTIQLATKKSKSIILKNLFQIDSFSL